MSEHAVAVPRRRLSKQERHTQLLAAARDLIRDSGTDEFTLARLADRAGVTKPLVYDHFGDRAGVLAALYREFEARQRETLAAALGGAGRELPAVAGLVAAAYIDCCLAEGRELADVVAALAGSTTLTLLRQEAEDAYLAMCREALEPLAGPIDAAALHAIIGAGDALTRGALAGRISAARARSTLARVVTAIATDDGHDTEEQTA
ncbi:TetR/AcrR family transcriptional regulator [Auraticoccus monumenti]|uniref:DNA-binding transcriptional regulator, AcrR family n=1 Tax=Auraticoccus monumenti TaxID=675864 RepID=A0A1G6Y332_9ACTN|nr:TetR/AcrR family transcriptional regulator [Auraticoccus monumenti]SDD84904.1 DNA-binding transcriptional regulator, AcrR family [Auraticoccus monumenti]